MDKQEPLNIHNIGEALSLRRWDAAKINRLNQHQFACVHGESINCDLHAYLETLRARCEHEAANNPMMEGVINTYACDVVGRDGPKLQVQSDSTEFNEFIEENWKVFAEMPDPNGRVGLPDMLRLWVRKLWDNGEFLVQFTTMERPSSPVQLGLRTIPARRLATPSSLAGDSNIFMGIRLTKQGKPQQYYIQDSWDACRSQGTMTDYSPVPPDMLLHRFIVNEPDQLRGYPWLAVSLQVMADLRDYDFHVLEAAKNAAAQGVIWHTQHPDAEYVEVNETVKYTPGSETTGPPGWSPMMINSTQPTANYTEFRHERLRELGRAVNMPLMMVMLSSADSNFSSAHYDGQIYSRGIQSTQSWLSRMTLNHIVAEMVKELRPEMQGIVSMPRTYRLDWTWNVAPYVNPKQMYDSLRARLEDGTAAYSDVLAAYGMDLESTVGKRKRENDILEKADLPPLPVNLGDKKDPDDEQAIPAAATGQATPANGKPRPSTARA